MKLINAIHIIFITLFLIIFGAKGIAQNWPKIYGDYIDAYGEDLIENYDKGYLLCGSIMKDASHFNYGWLIKTDINGNVLWDKKFGDATREDYFLDFDKTSDNGWIISGSTSKFDIENDPLFIKFDPCGEIEWCSIFLCEGLNYAAGIITLPENEYLGLINYFDHQQKFRISLVKMNFYGEPIWIKHLANEDSTLSNEEGQFLNILNNGNYLISGYCFSPSIKPFFIATDTAGEQLWDIRWPVGSEGYANRSVFASNGNIYTATGLTFPGLPRIPYLLKFNENGDIINQFPLLGDTIERGGAKSLLIIHDTILYVGLTWTDDPTYYEGYSDILKTDTTGNLILQRRLIDDNHAPTSTIESFDSKIITMGQYYVDGNWDIYLWKMNEDLVDDTLYTQPLTYDSLCPYQILSDTVDLDCSLFVNIEDIPTKEEYEATIKISPNPARDWISLTLPDNVSSGGIELAIYNIFGQEVMKTRATPQNRTASLNISNLSSGFYLAVCKDAKKKIFKGKFVVGR